MTPERVLQILNEHDPMGLLRMGCPDDEYAAEAEEIASKASAEETLSTLTDIVFGVFRQSFAYDHEQSLIPDIPVFRARYERIASDLLDQ